MFKGTSLRVSIWLAGISAVLLSGGAVIASVQSTPAAIASSEQAVVKAPILSLEGDYLCEWGKAQLPNHGSFLVGEKSVGGFEFFSPEFRLREEGHQVYLTRTEDQATLHLGEIAIGRANCQSSARPTNSVKIALPVRVTQTLQVHVSTSWSLFCESGPKGRGDSWIRSGREILTLSDRLTKFKLERRVEKVYSEWYACQITGG